VAEYLGCRYDMMLTKAQEYGFPLRWVQLRNGVPTPAPLTRDEAASLLVMFRLRGPRWNDTRRGSRAPLTSGKRAGRGGA